MRPTFSCLHRRAARVEGPRAVFRPPGSPALWIIPPRVFRMRALSLPGCACRGAFQVGVLARLAAAGERFDIVAGASSGSICGAIAVAGRAAQGPDLARELAGAPIVSTRYLGTERSIFGVGRI